MNKAKLMVDLRKGERLHRKETRLMEFPNDEEFPEIVTICGSTKFKDEYLEVMKRLTLEGKNVISVGLWGHSGDAITKEQKKILDELHLRKIDLSDGIYVIDVNGYIGESTRREIEYARCNGKNIKFYSKD